MPTTYTRRALPEEIALAKKVGAPIGEEVTVVLGDDGHELAAIASDNPHAAGADEADKRLAAFVEYHRSREEELLRPLSKDDRDAWKARQAQERATIEARAAKAAAGRVVG